MQPIRTREEAEDAEKAARERFEKMTTAFVLGGYQVSMAEARAVFDKYHCPAGQDPAQGYDWKRPVNALVALDDVEKFQGAVTFYQGVIARVRAGSGVPVGYVRVTSTGYIG